jgi:hypothetical protein
VQVADMRVVVSMVSEERRTRQSTLVKYLQLIGPVPEGSMFPNECRPYLAGIVDRGAQLKFLLRAGMLPLGRLESRKRRRGVASVMSSVCWWPGRGCCSFCVHVWCAACGEGSHVLAVGQHHLGCVWSADV